MGQILDSPSSHLSEAILLYQAIRWLENLKNSKDTLHMIIKSSYKSCKSSIKTRLCQLMSINTNKTLKVTPSAPKLQIIMISDSVQNSVANPLPGLISILTKLDQMTNVKMCLRQKVFKMTPMNPKASYKGYLTSTRKIHVSSIHSEAYKKR
jgi:hypothetical protein